jgi:hypothetical protein
MTTWRARGGALAGDRDTHRSDTTDDEEARP